MHRKKDDAGSEWLAVLDLGSKFVEAAISTPRRLRPSLARWRIAPQNFSRGLVSVAITSAPGRKG